MGEEHNVAGPESRVLSIGINVSDAKKLPKVGEYVSGFLSNLTREHGLFSVNLALSVEPTESSAIGLIEYPNNNGGNDKIDIVFIPEGDE